jgi:hypothetical protein
MKLKIGQLVNDEQGGLFLVTSIMVPAVFGPWLSLTRNLLDISDKMVLDIYDGEDYEYGKKATEEEMRYFIRGIFKAFENGVVKK